jgi:hypothetical protein
MDPSPAHTFAAPTLPPVRRSDRLPPGRSETVGDNPPAGKRRKVTHATEREDDDDGTFALS